MSGIPCPETSAPIALASARSQGRRADIDSLDAFHGAAKWAAARADGIEASGFDAPTPCSDWSVGELADHLVRGNLRFAAGVRGDDPDTVVPEEVVGDDLAGSYRAASDAVVAAMNGDVDLERQLAGGLSVAELLEIMFTEQLLHGWDLAVATGQSAEFDADLADRADRFLRPLVGSGQAATAYAAPVPVEDGASVQDRLLALVGRDPAWRP